MFAIDSNIPAPTHTRVRAKGSFATTAEALEVGQSFMAPGRSPKGVYASLSQKKHPGKKFRVASVEASGDVPSGVRVWRTL
jgi:hypothetical protein